MTYKVKGTKHTDR